MNKLIVTLCLLLLTACTLTPQLNAPIAIYDLGIPQAENNQIANQPTTKSLSILVTDIVSPVWLDNHAIHYRLAYQNPAQLHAYANSRWAAAPAALLTRQISMQLMANTIYEIININDGIHADFTLNLTLEDFTQTFNSANESHATIHLNASLIEHRTRTLTAQHQFTIQKIASTSNSAGGVYALIEASNQLNIEIIDWLSNELAVR